MAYSLHALEITKQFGNLDPHLKEQLLFLVIFLAVGCTSAWREESMSRRRKQSSQGHSDTFASN